MQSIDSSWASWASCDRGVVWRGVLVCFGFVVCIGMPLQALAVDEDVGAAGTAGRLPLSSMTESDNHSSRRKIRRCSCIVYMFECKYVQKRVPQKPYLQATAVGTLVGVLKDAVLPQPLGSP